MYTISSSSSHKKIMFTYVGHKHNNACTQSCTLCVCSCIVVYLSALHLQIYMMYNVRLYANIMYIICLRFAAHSGFHSNWPGDVLWVWRDGGMAGWRDGCVCMNVHIHACAT